jgi:hypothetical protein
MQLSANQSVGFYLRAAAYWATFESLRRETQTSQFVKTAGIIGLGSLLVELFTFPITRVRTLVYSSFERDSRLIKSVLMILRTERFSGLYKGFGFWSYGFTLQHMLTVSLWYGVHVKLGQEQSTTAAVSGAIVSAFIYPFDTVVRRYQLDGLTTAGKWHDSPKKLAKQIWNKQGIKGFYSGYSLYLFTSIFSSLATIKCFEHLSSRYRMF